MTPTAELRARLRKLLNEQIPDGGSETDTKFLDSELDELLTESNTVYSAAAAGWTIKAGLLQSQIESYSAGQERYDLTSLKDQLSHALTMAEKYAMLAKTNIGSVILKLSPPEVL